MTIPPGWTICESPIGPLTVVAGASGRGIAHIHFDGHAPRLPEAARRPMPEATGQLDAYFAGERQAFELDLDLHGKPLQRKVWQLLLEIPFGETTTYGEVAARIDEAIYDAGHEPYERPRVVGAAIGRNPVPVVIPCHRVIGADGSLTGFFGGLERKRLLLSLEGLRLAGDKVVSSAGARQQLALL
jgi:methylated-DNA-[protein]-cysteine S-methyltransferase